MYTVTSVLRRPGKWSIRVLQVLEQTPACTFAQLVVRIGYCRGFTKNSTERLRARQAIYQRLYCMKNAGLLIALHAGSDTDARTTGYAITADGHAALAVYRQHGFL